MKPLVSYFLAVSFLLIILQETVQMEECIFRKLDREDKTFCRGSLEIFYPELGDVGCTYIPKCNAYRKRISKEWISPEVRYHQADMNKKYVLIMVDPDAPSRSNPEYRFWRHWAVTDISSYSALALEETDFEDFCAAVLMLGVSGKKTTTFNFSQLSLEKSSFEDYHVSPAIWEKSVIAMGTIIDKDQCFEITREESVAGNC
ncbi:phosphatidylethanolamine-binding protein 4-like [Protobothrops mucrosquamatus]|uniref:phosphatidylethanolamine-binding protein 4-like n=1 Tax=Protobothrops mucrosquamatus TaxID=103944 RepID=UPI0007758C8F|nr:phosphatidylethanolamine-binding protein 4-like [Protobothrops mucrosquamatus]